MKSSDLEHKLERLADAIEKIAKPIPAIPSIPAIAPIPAIPAISSSIEDHNLLIKLDTKVDQIQVDISDLKKDKNIYITLPQHTELVNCSADHETRIRTCSGKIETLDKEIEIIKSQFRTWGIAFSILVALIQVALHFWK